MMKTNHLPKRRNVCFPGQKQPRSRHPLAPIKMKAHTLHRSDTRIYVRHNGIIRFKIHKHTAFLCRIISRKFYKVNIFRVFKSPRSEKRRNGERGCFLPLKTQKALENQGLLC